MTTATFDCSFHASTNSPTRWTSSCRSTPNRSSTARANAREQRRDVVGARAADVDDEVGVQRRDFRAALAPALGAGGFDQPGRLVARRDCGNTSRRWAARSAACPCDARAGPAFARARRSGRPRERQRDARDDRVARERRVAVEKPHASPGAAAGFAGDCTHTSRTKSPISRSVPAFMRSEPPTVPGIPASDRRPSAPASRPWPSRRPCSPTRPLDDDRAVFDAARRLRQTSPPSRSTTPRIPPSPTSRLLPPPSTNHGILPLEAPAHQRRRVRRRDARSTNASAGPPIFHDVCGASGSSKRTPVAENLDQRCAIAIGQQRTRRLRGGETHARTASERASALREPCGDVGDVPGARASARARRRGVSSKIRSSKSSTCVT